MDRNQALELAMAWYGMHADVNDEDLGEAPDQRFAIGYWKPNPTSADEFERQFGDFHCAGVGHTWEAAFRQAAPKRWREHQMKMRRRQTFRPEVTE